MKTKIVFLIAIVIAIFSGTCQQKDKGKQQEIAIENEITEVISEHEIVRDSGIKDMYPIFGRLLNFSKKDEAEFQNIMDALSTVKWDFDKLTDEQRQYVKSNNISEVTESYWETVGAGCNWYCGGGPDSISASSYLKSNHKTINYLPENIHDFSFETAWVPEGNGIGEYLTYHFKQTTPKITRIIIANGYVKSEKAYQENSRVKKLKMYIGDKPFAILNLEDRRQIQIFEFEPIGKERPASNANLNELDKLPKWTMKFEILEVYKGDKYEDVAISEIYFDGIDVH